MQDHPGAPGTARQESTHIIVSTYDGGTATQPRAPGHERPFAALRAAKHGRLSAASTAPGADIPLATTAGAPGQYCQSAALRAPGHGRSLAIAAGAPCHDRLSAAPRAPADDAAPAIAATVPNHHRPSAAPIATVSSPAGLHRLRQEGLPRTPATPNTLIYSYPYHTVSSLRREPQYPSRPAAGHHVAPSPGACSGGGLGRGQLPAHPTTHQVHPAIQVLPHPRFCSTAATGGLRQHPSRAPPAPCPSLRRKPQSIRTIEERRQPPHAPGHSRARESLPLHMVERAGVRPSIPVPLHCGGTIGGACAPGRGPPYRPPFPFPLGRGPGGRSARQRVKLARARPADR